MKQSEQGTFILTDRWADYAALNSWLESAKAMAADDILEIGLDVETRTAKADAKQPNPQADPLVGVGISIEAAQDEAAFAMDAKEGSGLPVYGLATDGYLAVLKAHLPTAAWYAHNAMFDATVMRRYGISLGQHRGDARIIAYLLGEPDADLKSLLLKWLGYPVQHYAEVLEEWGAKDISEVPLEVQGDYCALQDAAQCVHLCRVMQEELPERSYDVYKGIELPMVNILVAMSERGIRFDREKAIPLFEKEQKSLQDLDRVIAGVVRKTGFIQYEERQGKVWYPTCKACRNGSRKRVGCTECGGSGKLPAVESPFNSGSPSQLARWLYDFMQAPINRFAGGRSNWAAKRDIQRGMDVAGGTDGLALLQLQHFHEAIPLILARRKLSKRCGFIGKWLELSEPDGRLHTQFRNTTVVSGRLSSALPNLMQVTQDLRDLFIADD